MTVPVIPAFYSPDIEPKISAAEATPEGLKVTFAGDGRAEILSWFWVKDHGLDPDSLDPDSLQRRTDSFSINEDIRARSIEFDSEQQLIKIHWDDGLSSVVSAYLLASVTGRASGREDLLSGTERVLWGKDNPLSELPSIDFDAVMAGDKALLNWMENICIFGFSMVDNVPPTPAGTIKLAERLGAAQETIFGKFWPLSSNLVDHGDTAYSTDYLEPHTDSTYYHDAPGLQLFNCIAFDAKGGESIQVDGFAAAQQLKDNAPDAYQLLSEISVPGHYLEDGVHLRAERTPLRLNAKGELIQVSFNNYDRAPFLLPDVEYKAFIRAYGLFHSIVNDQDNWLKIPLSPGRTLIFDNWRNLHGRMGYVGRREFYGCYHSRSVFESTLRILRASAGNVTNT